MLNGVVNTLKGGIAIANGLVSLSDIWHNAGVRKLNNDPVTWCQEHDVEWHGDADEVFASVEVAQAYAWHVSPYLAGTLQSALKVSKQASPFEHYGVDQLKGSAAKSRDIFTTALEHAGIKRAEDFAKLTDLLYQHTMMASARCLRNAYKADGAVRSNLDVKSLAKVMTVEVNVTAAIYAESIQGYAELAHKIKQHASLVNALYKDKATTH